MNIVTQDGWPRIVITGIGAITPLGGVDELWENLKNGVSGVKELSHLDLSKINIHIAAFVDDFDPLLYMNKKTARRLPKCSQFTVAATELMLKDAGLTEDELAESSERTGVVVGTGLAGFESFDDGIRAWRAGGNPKPFAIPAGLANAPAHYVSLRTKALGPIIPVVAACASGTQALVEAMHLIRSGRADRVFVGGVESTMKEYTLAGFDAMTGLARGYNDMPEKASRPFDKNRNGFVFGEGAAIFVMETLELALARNAHIYAEVVGGAISSDAFHLVILDPEGKGAVRAMKWALDDAKLDLDAINYINAHGTSTKLNDKVETLAIKKLFGQHAYDVPISSTKSMVGHCMGAAGAIEAIACIKTIEDQAIHPTINYETPDEECDLDYVPNVARDSKVQYALSSDFGLGGQNASIVLGRI